MLNTPQLPRRIGPSVLLTILLASILASCNLPTGNSNLPVTANSPTNNPNNNSVVETVNALAQTVAPTSTATVSPTVTQTPTETDVFNRYTHAWHCYSKPAVCNCKINPQLISGAVLVWLTMPSVGW